MWETESEQVLWRKDEKHFEKRVKRLEIVEAEAVEMNGMLVLGEVCLSTIVVEADELSADVRQDGVKRH